jgi:uncharacterized alkaline shock family protein YloU
MAFGAVPAPSLPIPSVPIPSLPAPGERGSISLADRVLARIAARAAAEALAEHLTGAGAGAGVDPERVESPRATASQGRRGVSIRVRLDLTYPLDIAAVTRAVHSRVVERVVQLAGTEDPRISLVVERLVPAAPSGRLL